MQKSDTPEFWLRGPVSGIPPLLQPVAHALLQARAEVMDLMSGFPEDRLWDRPAGVASPGFHLQHLAGVLDRLFTYARAEGLTREQGEALAAEGKPSEHLSVSELTGRFSHQVDRALGQLQDTPERALTGIRGVGRAQIPSTVLGLLVHAAEHVQRHNGQLRVTVHILTSPSQFRQPLL
jgi:uncharacterized damage-inducible protein DinB